MTIAELLARIGLAFTRTFDLVMEGAFNDVVLADVSVIAVSVGLFFCCIALVMVSIRALLAVIAIAAVVVAAIMVWP